MRKILEILIPVYGTPDNLYSHGTAMWYNDKEEYSIGLSISTFGMQKSQKGT